MLRRLGLTVQASDTVQYLDNAINALLLTWSATTVSGDGASGQTSSNISIQAKSVLEKMFTANPAAVVGSCIQVWAARSPDITVSRTSRAMR
jgi:hypothetical protein